MRNSVQLISIVQHNVKECEDNLDLIFAGKLFQSYVAVNIMAFFAVNLKTSQAREKKVLY